LNISLESKDMRITRTYKKRNNGFTLIELIVTISIATILASIAIPSFTELIRSNQLTSGTNELVSSLILARSEALKRNNNVSLCASLDQTTCSGTDFSTGWIVFVDCNADPNGTIDGGTDCNGDGDTTDVGDNDPIIKVHGPIEGMSISKNGTASYQTFNFTGRAPVSTITVASDDGENTRQISVSATGRVNTNN